MYIEHIYTQSMHVVYIYTCIYIYNIYILCSTNNDTVKAIRIISRHHQDWMTKMTLLVKSLGEASGREAVFKWGCKGWNMLKLRFFRSLGCWICGTFHDFKNHFSVFYHCSSFFWGEFHSSRADGSVHIPWRIRKPQGLFEPQHFSAAAEKICTPKASHFSQLSVVPLSVFFGRTCLMSIFLEYLDVHPR